MSIPSSQDRPRGWPLIQGLVIVLAAAWVYWPALHGAWIWDDGLEIARNPLLRDPDGWWKPWVTASSMDYFPLKSTLQWGQWHLWGGQVLGYHLTNVCLHGLSALLLWRLLHQLGARCAWAGGLIFAVHPLAVESVAWISEFKNTLSLPLLLGAMIAWVNWDEKRHAALYLLSLALFLVAMLSKTSVVMFPVVILLYCWWRRGQIGRRDFLASAPFLAVSLLLGSVTLWFQSHRAIGLAGTTAGFASRLAQAGWSTVLYFRQCVFPVHLMPIYPAVRTGLLAVLPWLAIAGVLAWLCSASPRQSSPRRFTLGEDWRRDALFWVGWFLLNLFPVLGLVPMAYLRVAPRADHFAYLPLVGLAGLAAVALGALRRSGFPAVLGPCLAALVLALACEARGLAAIYRNDEALWSYAVLRNPGAWLARNNLGKVFLEEGRPADAAEQLQEAVRLEPDSPEAHADLGNALEKLGQAAEARGQYEEALRRDPGWAGAHYDLGLSFLMSGQPAEAADEFRAALRRDPAYAVAHNNLGLAMARLGQSAQAMAEYQRALQINPDLPEARLNLGNALFTLGRLPEAIDQYRDALRVSPGYAAAHQNLGYALERLGREQEAQAEFAAAQRSASDLPK